jgi:hypothetical protein
MMDLLLNDNDLMVANGDFLMCATDTDAIGQTISTRLKILADEWFLDSNIGIPYLSKILGKKRNDRFLQKLITDEIRTVPSVKELHNFSFNDGIESRLIVVKFKTVLSNKIAITINESVRI